MKEFEMPIKPAVAEPGHDGWLEAYVVKNDDPLGEGRVRCVLPRLQPSADVAAAATARTEQIRSDIFMNEGGSPVGESSVKLSAGMWLRPCWTIFTKDKKAAGGQHVVPKVGDRVEAFFLDEDPKKGYYRPATMTRPGEKTPGKNLPGKAAELWSSPEKKVAVQLLLENVLGCCVGLVDSGDGQAFLVLDRENHIDVSKGVVTVKTKKVDLGGGATEHLVLGDAFKGLYDSHVHPTGVGPSGPPVMKMLKGVHLSNENVTL